MSLKCSQDISSDSDTDNFSQEFNNSQQYAASNCSMQVHQGSQCTTTSEEINTSPPWYISPNSSIDNIDLTRTFRTSSQGSPLENSLTVNIESSEEYILDPSFSNSHNSQRLTESSQDTLY